jgi:hypothetical protein
LSGGLGCVAGGAAGRKKRNAVGAFLWKKEKGSATASKAEPFKLWSVELYFGSNCLFLAFVQVLYAKATFIIAG